MLLCFAVLVACLVSSDAEALAQQATTPWQPEILDHHAVPGRLIAVDKSEQRLFLLERRSPLAQTRKFICSTGKKEGDKSVEGDLKTPEGIYFIVQYINSGLDFLKYGKEAYTLNYPNPVDRLRQKTGYGIWIHGRGEPIVPMQTEGCVAMINEDLAGMGKILEPGLPVALTNKFSIKNGAEAKAGAETVAVLEKRVRAWANAWASRSHDFFDFYDQNAYTIAQNEPFSRFRAQKERLFKVLPWIKIEVSDVQVLEGPGYWVTWFHQDYSAPNLTSKGVRRLYWQKDTQGEFRILGMEWVPGLSTGTLLASAEPALPPLEAAPRTEEQKAAPAEGTAIDTAVLVASADRIVAVASSVSGKAETADMNERPEPLLAPFLIMLNTNNGKVPKGEWTGSMPLPEKEPKPLRLTTAEQPAPQKNTQAAVTPAKEKTPAANGEKASVTEKAGAQEQRPGLLMLGGTLDKALHAAASVPAAPPANKEESLPAQKDGKDASTQVTSAAPPLQANGEQVGTRQAPSGSGHLVAGRPDENAAGDPKTRQHGEEVLEVPKVTVFFGEHAPGNKPDPEENTSPAPAQKQDEQDTAAVVLEITKRIQEWGESWQAADLDAYTSFYGSNAIQGSRRGSNSIRHHKEALWRRNKPEKVSLNDIQVSVNGDQATARMVQQYSSSTGHMDIGYKTLILKKVDGVWRITQEDWKAQPDG